MIVPLRRSGDAVGDVAVPVPELAIRRVAALQRDVRELAQPGQLADVSGHVGALAVLDDVAVAGEPAAPR